MPRSLPGSWRRRSRMSWAETTTRVRARTPSRSRVTASMAGATLARARASPGGPTVEGVVVAAAARLLLFRLICPYPLPPH
eukprot:scaffold10793_cov140-Isochrysis_galbana.AAC.2